MSGLSAALAGLLFGVAIGRLARRAANADTRRRTGDGPDEKPGSGAGSGPARGAVEIIAALVLATVGARFGPSWEAAPYPLVVWTLLTVSLTDLQTRRIPDRILRPAVLGCAAMMAVVAIGADRPDRLIGAAWGAVLYGGILLAIHLLRPDGMGRGDVKLAVMIGATIGWSQPGRLATLELVVWSLLVASSIGLVAALVRRPTAKTSRTRLASRATAVRRRSVPFGPALSASAVSVVVLGDLLVS